MVAMFRWISVSFGLAVLLMAGCQAKNTEALEARELVAGLNNPWGMDFLSDGRIVISERPGQLRVFNPATGKLSAPLQGLPAMDAGGQGGLLDVAVDNNWIYFSFSEPAASGGGNSTAVARARLSSDGTRLEQLALIFSQKPKYKSNAHFGSRLVFDGKGRLFITLGDRFARMDDAQTLNNHHGKTIRINLDGSVPTDNPFVSTKNALPEIWSYGHRNIQGASLHPQTGQLWIHEHGPQGGDEINIAEAGKNYGWPVITYGEQYGGGKIGEGTHKEGMEQPLHYWVPSIAPSGMAFLTSDRYPGWKGQLFVGALREEVLVRLELNGKTIKAEHRLLENAVGRIRDVVQGPDGYLYLLTDSRNGKLLKLFPQEVQQKEVQ